MMLIWTVLMLLSGALFTGGAVWYAWDRSVVWRTLSLAEFAPDFRRSIHRGDPAQPILLVAWLASTVGFGVVAGGTARLLAFAAAALLAVILPLALLLLVPVQRAFDRQPEGQLPDGAGAMRERWLRGHLGRTLMAATAFALIAFAVAVR